MIFPSIGFFYYFLISVAAGSVVLSFHPRWRLELINMVFFVAGSLLAGIAAGAVLPFLISLPAFQHKGNVVLILGWVFLLIAMLIGGFFGVASWQKIISRKMKDNK